MLTHSGNGRLLIISNLDARSAFFQTLSIHYDDHQENWAKAQVIRVCAFHQLKLVEI
jgi:hypothetical protein